MHYNLLFNGCSYTQGSELQGKNDDFEYRDKHRYSQIVSERIGKTHDNISIGGGSNDRISRETMDWFFRGNTCDMAIIQFTSITRLEYISKYEQHPTNFLIGRHPTTKWKTTNINEYKVAQKAHEHYYDYFYNTNIGLYNFYKNLFILEQYFEKNNIKHIFLKLDINHPEILRIDQEKCKMLDVNRNQMDFYWQLGCRNRYSKITSIRNGILDIKDKKYFTKDYSKEGYHLLNGSHPSELGHQKIADYIIDQLNK